MERRADSMRLDEFTEEIRAGLQRELGSSCRIEKKTLDGMNGIKKHSLLVAGGDSGIFPCLNMGEYYRRYENGEAFRNLFQMILSQCRSAPPFRPEDVAGLFCWDSVKPRIYAKLVNTGKNERLLRDVPHRQFLDLSLVYYVRTDTEQEETHGSILIHYGHMERWEADEDMLFGTAWDNMERTDGMLLEDMDDAIKQLLAAGGSTGDFITPGLTASPRMYILGSKNRMNGAVQMCSPKALKKAADSIGSDFWILPSSVHELILVPLYAMEADALELAEIVRGVNDTQVQPDEILSYHVYRYRRNTETLSMEA